MTATLTEPAATTPSGAMKPLDGLASVAAELQSLQRERAALIKLQVGTGNRLRAAVAGSMGYAAGLEEKDRKRLFEDAGRVIDAVRAGEADHRLGPVIRAAGITFDAMEGLREAIEEKMAEQAGRLPERVLSWLGRPEQRGFGLLSLAKVVGETGDLNGYANPAKVWRRMGCAPWPHGGETRMGGTWRREGLPAGEWEAYGYSPRRRSIMYVTADCLVKLNGPGPYRARYLAAKESAAARHPDWPKIRCHLHGHLLAAKLLLKSLWLVWTDTPYRAWQAA